MLYIYVIDSILYIKLAAKSLEASKPLLILAVEGVEFDSLPFLILVSIRKRGKNYYVRAICNSHIYPRNWNHVPTFNWVLKYNF